jgi:hypothetical protein
MNNSEIINLLEHPQYDAEGFDQEGWSKDDLMAKAANLLAQAVGVSLAESSEYLFLNRNPVAAAAAKIREFEQYPKSVWIVGKLWVGGSLRGKFNSISTSRQTEFDNEDDAYAAATEYNRQDGIDDDAERQWATRETEKEFSL